MFCIEAPGLSLYSQSRTFRICESVGNTNIQVFPLTNVDIRCSGATSEQSVASMAVKEMCLCITVLLLLLLLFYSPISKYHHLSL